MATPRKPVLLEPLTMAKQCVEEARTLASHQYGRAGHAALRMQELQLIVSTMTLQELISVKKILRDQLVHHTLIATQTLPQTAIRSMEQLIADTEGRTRANAKRAKHPRR